MSLEIIVCVYDGCDWFTNYKTHIKKAQIRLQNHIFSKHTVFSMPTLETIKPSIKNGVKKIRKERRSRLFIGGSSAFKCPNCDIPLICMNLLLYSCVSIDPYCIKNVHIDYLYKLLNK